MSELFVVGISWRTAPVAVREQLAFREEELAPTLRALTEKLPVTEAFLISTCNRVELYGVAGADVTTDVRAFLTEQRGVKSLDVTSSLYHHRGSEAIRHVFRVASALDSLVVGEAQILGQLKQAYAIAGAAGTVGSVLSRCVERAFGVAKRVRTETTIARGAANVSSVAVELASHVFGKLEGKSVLVVGAGKMSTLAARHLHASGAEIIVTNRSPEKAEALAAEIDADARPWEDLAKLLAAADVVISSTGAREPILTKALFKQVMKARRWRPIIVIDIAVPRDADPAIGNLDEVYLYDIDKLDRVVQANLAERAKAAEQAARIVEHEATQFEQWVRTQAVVPTIRALREKFGQIADAEVAKAIDQLARKDLTRDQQRELVQRVVQLVVNKLLHAPMAALREAGPVEGALRAAVLAEVFALEIPTEVAEAAEEPEAAAVATAAPSAQSKAAP